MDVCALWLRKNRKSKTYIFMHKVEYVALANKIFVAERAQDMNSVHIYFPMRIFYFSWNFLKLTNG